MTKQLMAAMTMVLIAGSASVPAQTASAHKKAKTHKKTAAPKSHVESATERQIRELREEMRGQQAQIDALKQLNADKDAKLASAAADAATANTAAAAATAQAQTVSASVQATSDAITAVNSTVSDMKAANVGLAQTVSDTKRDLTAAIESPSTIHYKGVTITPVAFLAFENVFRTRATASDINTPFNATPFQGAAQAHVSELNFSGRQSRLGGLFVGNAGAVKLSGYFEADFLSSGVTSNSNQSNSYTLRQRQAWGQAATKSGFAVTGGQMWSLITETKTGTDNRQENLPMTIDPQYNVGFSWARQPAIRLQQKLGVVTAAMSLENAQILYAATNANPNFFIGNAGTGGGLYNATANYSNNVAPDVIVKFAFDPPKMGHYEVGGLARFFRDRFYPGITSVAATGAVGTIAGATNDTKVGGGVYGNARVPFGKFADIGVHAVAGQGVGRYGTSTLPDVTVHPNGTLAPIKSYQGLFSAEFHPMPKLDVFGYAGGEYAQRTVYLNTLPGTNLGKLTGYAPPTVNNAGCNIETLPTAAASGLGSGGAPYNPGVPASCGAATRGLMEGTAGFTYRAYNSPKFGRLQYQLQYSYLKRETWTGVGGSPNATNNMVLTGMRYYIP